MAHYRKQRVEEREHLFDADAIFAKVSEEITPALVRYYRELKETRGGGFAFAIERQSMGKEALGDPNQTGHQGRVRKIEALARSHGLYLPPAVLKPDHRPGEPPFILDERHWFVDGEGDRSSGYTFAPEVRPRFWHCYATIRRIGLLDPRALPDAILVADMLRFSRDDKPLKVWFNSLMVEGVRLITADSGPVAAESLDMIGFGIRMESSRFVNYRKQARQIAKAQKRILVGKRRFGLDFSEDRREVFTHPVEWPILVEVLTRLADNRLPTFLAAARWVRETYGKAWVISDNLIRKWLKDPIFVEGLQGTYVGYAHKSEPCIIKERRGPDVDFSYTARRNKRYMREPVPESEWVRLPINFERHGHAPIPPEIIEGARMKLGRPGRPCKDGEPDHPVLISVGLARCASCGYPVLERAPRKSTPSWSLECQCVALIKRKEGLTAEQVTDRPAIQHARYWTGTKAGALSLPVRELLKEKLFGEAFDLRPFLPARDAGETASRKLELETRQAALRDQLAQMGRNLALLDLGQTPDAARLFQEQMAKLSQEIGDCDRELTIIAAQSEARVARDTGLVEAQRKWKQLLPTIGDDPIHWRTIISMFVKQVMVDLTTGTFTVDCEIAAAALTGLSGRLVAGNCTYIRSCSTG
jgi:hypothetical protein